MRIRVAVLPGRTGAASPGPAALAGAAALALIASLLLCSGCGSSAPLTRVRTPDGFGIAVDLVVPETKERAPLVVLCHQTGADRTSWDPLVPRLIEKGFAVLRLDHRGFGESRGEADSPLALSPEARDAFHEDILAAIRAASKRRGVDASRTAVAASGFSITYAVRAARLDPRIRGLVLLSGYILSEDEDFLIAHPDLPVLFSVATGDVQGAQTLRQHAARIRGPHQQLIEIGPYSEDDPNTWRGTEGLAEEVGLADLIAWKIEEMLTAK